MTEQRPAAELRNDLLSASSPRRCNRRWTTEDRTLMAESASTIESLSAANLRLEQRVEELEMELRTIATRRFDRTVFDDDTSFADWAQSRARAALAKVRP